MAEIRASAGYDTDLVKGGAGAENYLAEMATRASDYVGVCAQVPEDAFDDTDSLNTAMYGTVLLLSFSQLVKDVPNME